MTNIADQVRESLYQRAKKAEDAWREKHGLSKELYRNHNAAAARRRKRAISPTEPKANAPYRRWKRKRLGKLGPASKVRCIDPLTGEVVQSE
jgi:hypothetical protein